MRTPDLIAALKSSGYPARFSSFMPFIYEWECVIGKSGNILVEREAGDAGGATFCGLDIASHPHLKFADMSAKDVCDVYFSEWQGAGIEGKADKLGECYFNCVVNCGGKRAKAILAVAKTGGAFLDEQDAFYNRIVSAKPSQAKFLKGWHNRTTALRKFLSI